MKARSARCLVEKFERRSTVSSWSKFSTNEAPQYFLVKFVCTDGWEPAKRVGLQKISCSEANFRKHDSHKSSDISSRSFEYLSHMPGLSTTREQQVGRNSKIMTEPEEPPRWPSL